MRHDCFIFNDTATTEIYTLSLHDALPISDRHDFGRVDVVLDGELAARDDTFGLVTDVEQDLVPVDLHDGAFDDVTVVEVLDGLVDGGEKVRFRADVVDRDLWRSQKGGSRSHEGVGSLAGWV